MRFTKPAWVIHQDGTRSENAKRLSIFSVHVHPDGSRIATGGLDAKVRIWSTKPILSVAADAAGKPPKALCTLAMHTGPVLTVRWAHSGRWLASGSDDEVVMIWDLDPSKAGKVWGSDDVNVEGWKPLKRLPGHESDVTDLAWSPEDRYLASTGLDSKVIIWCGYTLERLAKLDLHQGFVKGVCWDPVGEFLATQSDDRTVRIWRTTDWGLEATVARPFEHSPGSTFFRRLSWSPDGAHITASNATNNNGFVFTAAVIARSAWTSDISLVGHENTVEVAAYNPHIFLRDASAPPASALATSNICSVLALGADDRALSVWATRSARPLVVAHNAFERQIMDLAWAPDGLSLYAVSSDGTLACMAFDDAELEGRASKEAQRAYLAKFGFVPPPLPGGYRHISDVNGTGGAAATPPLSFSPAKGEVHVQQNGFGHAATAHPGEHVTTLVARRAPKGREREREREKNRRRVELRGAGVDVPSAAAPSVPAHPISNAMASASFLQPHPVPLSVSVSASSGFGAGFGDDGDSMDLDDDFKIPNGVGGMDMAVPISALDSRGRHGKGDSLPVATTYGDDAKPPKARTLGGDRVRGADSSVREVREIRRGGEGGIGGLKLDGAISYALAGGIIPVPILKTFLEVRVEDSGDVLEAKNAEAGKEPSELTFFAAKEKSVQWLDYLHAPALVIAASSRFCAVAMDDGTLNVYSLTGRRIMPTLTLGACIAFLEASGHLLMAITTAGQAFVWNTKTASALHPPTSLLPHLRSLQPSAAHPNGTIPPSIISASLRPNGAVLVHLSTGIALAFDAALASWVRVGDSWWAQGSSCWKGKSRQRSATAASASTSANAVGVVAAIEARITEHLDESGAGAGTEGAVDPPRPAWWSTALTLGHLEARMHSARVLGSASELRQALLQYARALADEGFRGKAEEVLKELYGPVYWRPGKSEDGWSSTVLGMPKRDLAKEVLTIFARSKTLCKLAQDYQELLKKASAED